MKKNVVLVKSFNYKKQKFVSFFQIDNPDMRVQILKDFVKEHFPSTQLLDYALDVEKITTSKVLVTWTSGARVKKTWLFLPFFLKKKTDEMSLTAW